jgi:hypothetical protein
LAAAPVMSGMQRSYPAAGPLPHHNIRSIVLYIWIYVACVSRSAGAQAMILTALIREGREDWGRHTSPSAAGCPSRRAAAGSLGWAAPPWTAGWRGG